jgi:Tol biopolymer transport system component
MPWRQLGVLALIALLLAVTAAVYVGSQPRPPEPFGLASNGQLAYAADGDLYVRDTIDGPARPLLTGPEVETGALYSPQGDRLIVFREVDGGEDLWLTTPAGEEPVRLGGPYVADWADIAPDGSAIAVGHVKAGIPVIDLVRFDGSGSTRIADIPAMSPTFRPPDGRQLLFRGQEAGRWGFYLLDLATNERVRLDLEQSGLEASGYDLRSPAWSPTGEQLAYDSLEELPGSQLGTPGLRVHVATVGPDGEIIDHRRLEADPVADDELAPIFTPDGRWIVFQQRFGWSPPDPASGVPTIDRVLVVPADGSAPARSVGVESVNGDGLWFLPAPDGSSVLVHLSKEAEDWMIDPVAGTASLTDLDSTTGVAWQRRGH